MSAEKVRRIAAAVLQGGGAVLPTALFAGYATGKAGEMWRAIFWLPGPMAIALAMPLGLGDERAKRYSAKLCLLYPIAPLLDAGTQHGSLHGGEVGFFIGIVVGLFGAAVLWGLLKWAEF
jgi:hypothetical protein